MAVCLRGGSLLLLVIARFCFSHHDHVNAPNVQFAVHITRFRGWRVLSGVLTFRLGIFLPASLQYSYYSMVDKHKHVTSKSHSSIVQSIWPDHLAQILLSAETYAHVASWLA